MRQHWIDTTKALCIIFVYYAHCCAYYGYGKESLLFAAINPFYVSMFFLVKWIFVCPQIDICRKNGFKKTGCLCLF